MTTERHTVPEGAVQVLRGEVDRIICWAMLKRASAQAVVPSGRSPVDAPVSAILARVMASRSQRINMCQCCPHGGECQEMLNATAIRPMGPNS